MFRTITGSLRDAGHRVQEVYGEDPYDLDSETWGLPLSGPRTRYKVPLPSSIWSMTGSLGRALACLRRAKPDVVYVHYVWINAVYFALLKPFFGYALVLGLRGSDINRPGVTARAFPLLFRAADRVIAISEDLKALALRYGADARRVEVVYNGADIGWWQRADAEVERDPKRIVFVGRLETVKGPDVLLEAFGRIAGASPEASLLLVGGGSLEESLRERAASLGLDERIAFCGPQDHQRIKEQLYRASVLAFPSRSEGFGLAMLEGMATGLPVAASNVGAIPEVLDGGGLLVPADDPDALAEALLRLLRDPDERDRLGRTARQRAETFSMTSCTAAYERVLTDAAERR